MLGCFKFLSYLCGRNKNDDYEVDDSAVSVPSVAV